jgi:hypothetical protein
MPNQTSSAGSNLTTLVCGIPCNHDKLFKGTQYTIRLPNGEIPNQLAAGKQLTVVEGNGPPLNPSPSSITTSRPATTEASPPRLDTTTIQQPTSTTPTLRSIVTTSSTSENSPTPTVSSPTSSIPETRYVDSFSFPLFHLSCVRSVADRSASTSFASSTSQTPSRIFTSLGYVFFLNLSFRS